MKSLGWATFALVTALVPACSSSSSTAASGDAGKRDAELHDGKADTKTGDDAATDAGSKSQDATSDAHDADPHLTIPDGPFDGAGFTPEDGGTAVLTQATPETWSWVPFADSRCRDGSTTGLGINLNPASDKVLIYLEGGGACFNPATCSVNPANFGAADLPMRFPANDDGTPESGNGILDRVTGNPVEDWNFIYVPYCTGDIHAGNNPAGVVEGLSPQVFMGYANVDLFLERLVPTFKHASQVLLTGISGGGFGAAANYAHVQRAFGDVPVSLIDDSGPFMQNPYLPTCLQDQVRTLWHLDATLGNDCEGHCDNPGSFFIDFAGYVAGKHPKQQFGLMDSTDDGTITEFFAYGSNDCAPSIFPKPETGAEFTAGLKDIRTTLKDAKNLSTFYFTGTDHTSLGGDTYFTRTAGTTALTDWVADIIGNTTTNVGP